MKAVRAMDQPEAIGQATAGIVVTADGFMPSSLGVCGLGEMTELFRVSKHTTNQWAHRDRLPPPDGVVTGRGLWHIRTLIRWGQQSGRLVYLHPDAAARYLPRAA